MNRRGSYYPNAQLIELKKSQSVTKSRILLICGCLVCGVGTITAVLALTLPYWVYITETMETTVAGLTDATEVKYYYGLLRYCLLMKATHLDRDECGSRNISEFSDWEYTSLVLISVSVGLLPVAIVMTVLNLCCWNKLVFLVWSTITAYAAGICLAVSVSLYQINATVQILDIGGLTTKSFEPGLLNIAFSFGFASGVIGFCGGTLLMFGTFTWVKPKGPRKNHCSQNIHLDATEFRKRAAKMGFASCRHSKSHLFSSVGVSVSFLSCLLSLLAFFLPYWVYMVETFTVRDISSTFVMHLHCNYGFWKYCSGATSSSQTSYSCGDVATHHAWEQATVCLVLFAFILQINCIINGVLYLIFYKEEKLCLIVAGSSAGIACVLLLCGVITYGSQEHRIQVTEAFVIPFKLSHLHASFWCAVSSCALSFIVTILFIHARVELASEYRGSVLESGIAVNTDRYYTSSALNCSEEQTSDNLQKQVDIVSNNNFQSSSAPLVLPASSANDRDQISKTRCLVLNNVFNEENDNIPKFLISKLRLHKKDMNKNSFKLLNSVCSADKSFDSAVNLIGEAHELTEEKVLSIKHVKSNTETFSVSNKAKLEIHGDNWKTMTHPETPKQSADSWCIDNAHEKHTQLKTTDSLRSHKEKYKYLNTADLHRSMTEVNTRKIVAQQCPKHLYKSAWDIGYAFENRP